MLKVAWMFYPGWQQVYKEYMESPTWGGMFPACEFETSLMLAAREELVHMERAVQEYPRDRRFTEWITHPSET